ncbi:MAG: SgcJ/EcaC family oxidoreductase [Chloroflexota bacterium]
MSTSNYPGTVGSAGLHPIERLYRQMIDAWNRRDAAGLSLTFSPDADVIGFDGSVMHGRDEIRETLDHIFRDHATPPYVVKVRSIRMVSVHTGILFAVVGMVPPGGSDLDPALNAMQVVVAAHRDGRLVIESLQNTPAQFHGHPELAAALTSELRQVRSDG